MQIKSPKHFGVLYEKTKGSPQEFSDLVAKSGVLTVFSNSFLISGGKIAWTNLFGRSNTVGAPIGGGRCASISMTVLKQGTQTVADWIDNVHAQLTAAVRASTGTRAHSNPVIQE